MNIWKWIKDFFRPAPADNNGQNTQEYSSSTTQESVSIHIDNEIPDCLKVISKADDNQSWDFSQTIEDNEVLDSNHNRFLGTQKELNTDSLSRQSDVSVGETIIQNETLQQIGLHYSDNTTSLLDDKNLVRLFSECTSLIEQLDKLSQGFQSENEQLLIQMVKEKLYNALLSSGGTSIKNEKLFDIIHHKSINCCDAKDGMIIENTIEPGLSLEDRVFIRAKVNLKIENDVN